MQHERERRIEERRLKGRMSLYREQEDVKARWRKGGLRTMRIGRIGKGMQRQALKWMRGLSWGQETAFRLRKWMRR